MSIGWQTAAQLRAHDFSISDFASARGDSVTPRDATKLAVANGANDALASLSLVTGNPLLPGSTAHVTTPFGGGHGLSLTPRPIPGPGTNTVVSDYTAILDSSWYNASAAGPPEADHPIILTFSFETMKQDYLLERGYSAAFRDSFVPLDAGEKDLVRDSLAEWADISGLILIEVGAGLGDIQFSGKYDFDLDPGTAGFAGFAYYGALDDSDGFDYSGDVFFDSETALIKMVALHEIGHALGFKHPFTGDPTLDEDFDDHDHTVMSYTGGIVTELGPFDVDAVHHVYGVDADDGTHVSSWSYNSTKGVLTQNGFATADLIRGIHGKDKISGGDGDDDVYGNAGKDTLKAGAGEDLVNGGDGDDNINSGSGNDTIHAGLGGDTVDAGVGDDDTDDFGGVNQIDSGKGDDVVTYWRFEDPSDQVWTFAAVIDGFSLSDGSTILNTETFYLTIGDGDDTITFDNVGNGTYVITDSDGDDAITVDFSASNKYVLSDDGGVVTSLGDAGYRKEVFFSDFETMHVIGGTADDFLSGDVTDDTLEGGKGDDILTGDLGSDTLEGGKGADFYAYDTAADSTGPGRDKVIGFDALSDSFEVFVAVTGVDAMVSGGALSEGSFNADLAAAIGSSDLAANHAVLFDPSSGNLKNAIFLIIDQDGTSGYDADVDLVIQLSGAQNLGSLDTSDFTDFF